MQTWLEFSTNGFKTGDGLSLTSTAVGYIRAAYGLKSRFDRLRERGMLTMLEVARRCGVSTKTISDWRRKSRIRAHAVNDRNQFLFDDPGPNPLSKNGRSVSGTRCSPVDLTYNPPEHVVPSYYRDKSLLRSPKNGTSQPRIESIPIESICSSMSSGEQMLGDDHLTIWSNQKRYVVGGWRVQRSGTPVFH